MKLAFVVQRYGSEVNGGAELHCRWLAEQLARRHHVEIFTTRALDYTDWADSYPAGTTEVGGIPVHRFGVKRRRKARLFASISNVVFGGPHTLDEEKEWVRVNGPESPDLLAAIGSVRARFDLFIFFSYRYYHTYFGLPKVRDKAILIPTAEEDEAVHLRVFRDFFRLPSGIAYNTLEEQALVESAADGTGVPSAIVGCGLSLSESAAPLPVSDRFGLGRPFILYLGRVEPNKGCATLFAYFQKWADAGSRDVDLVLAGKAGMPIPDHPRIRFLGFVSEEEKVRLLLSSRMLVMPSRYESLSLVLLEAWKMGVPVLANARCRVLLGQCRRSNGGLAYDGYGEFAEALSLLLERPELGESLGRQGRSYVEREYSWERILGTLEELFRKVTNSNQLAAPPA